ncbi:MAG: tetratricopeptide repeat protein [bacterium]
MRSIGTLFCFAFLLAEAVLGSPRSLFEKGVDAYRQGDMEKAREAWQSAYDEGIESGALCYNLGNAYFRLGQTAKAILFYERARRELPRDKDVVTNLKLARMAVVDRVEPPLRLVIWNWVDAVRDFFSLRELQLLLAGLGVLAAAAVIAVSFFPGRIARAIPTAIVALWLVFGILFAWRTIVDGQSYGVITATKVDVKSAPDEASKDVFALHEGLKVRIRANLAGWLNIELADGRQGWIPAVEAEQI